MIGIQQTEADTGRDCTVNTDIGSRGNQRDPGRGIDTEGWLSSRCPAIWNKL